MDFLQACKFAEGDSRILMQKMARDRLKQFSSGKGDDFSADEKRLCSTLGANMAAATKSGTDKQQAWDDEWKTVYELADAVIERVHKAGSCP
jgi:acyl-CoA oxidase